MLDLIRTHPVSMSVGVLLALAGIFISLPADSGGKVLAFVGAGALLVALFLVRRGRRARAGGIVLALAGTALWIFVVATLGLDAWPRQAPTPQVTVAPASGTRSTLFTGEGSGFSPNGGIEVTATKPDGSRYRTLPAKTADGSGEFVWQWRWEPGDPDGTWTITFKDLRSGKPARAKLTINPSPSPGLSASVPARPLLAVTPRAGDHTTVFKGTAAGFTPGSSLRISAVTPAGVPYPETYSKVADSTGSFAWSWKWEPGDEDGAWTVTAREDGSGLAASTTLTIHGSQESAPVSPVASVSPRTGSHSTRFAGDASGFTPRGSVVVSAIQPDGKPYPHVYPKAADADGRLSWSWAWDAGDPDGVWTIVLTDRASGRKASTTLTIRGSTS